MSGASGFGNCISYPEARYDMPSQLNLWFYHRYRRNQDYIVSLSSLSVGGYNLRWASLMLVLLSSLVLHACDVIRLVRFHHRTYCCMRSSEFGNTSMLTSCYPCMLLSESRVIPPFATFTSIPTRYRRGMADTDRNSCCFLVLHDRDPICNSFSIYSCWSNFEVCFLFWQSIKLYFNSILGSRTYI
jgi:hypothetical protein